MAGLHRLTIAQAVEITRSAGESTTVDHFVATYCERYAPSQGRTHVLDLLCRLVNAGHLVVEDDIIRLPSEVGQR